MIPGTKAKDHYSREELLACGRGEMFGPGNAQLPIPPMLMFDRITRITDTGGAHDKGQVILSESGRLRTGRRGEAIKEYPAGGTEYTGPNIEHWHGATPGEALVQVNIQFGGTTKWLTKTTDDEYAGKAKK